MTDKFKQSIFIDTADLAEIKKWNATGIIDGVTTNQYILIKEHINPRKYEKIIENICLEMKSKPVSVELSESKLTSPELVKEARRLNNLARNIVVKVPLIPNSQKSWEVIKELIKENIAVNITILMTFEQLILAILASRNSSKPSFISLFWGRTIEDHANYRSRFDFMAKFPKVGLESNINSEPKNIVNAARNFLTEGNYSYPKLIIGSIRTASMVGEAFAAGANIVTVTPDILTAMMFSQRTIETLTQFDGAWTEFKKKK